MKFVQKTAGRHFSIYATWDESLRFAKEVVAQYSLDCETVSLTLGGKIVEDLADSLLMDSDLSPNTSISCVLDAYHAIHIATAILADAKGRPRIIYIGRGEFSE